MRTAGKRHREENQKSDAVRFMRKEWIGTPASTYFISFCHFLIFSFLHFCYSCEKRLSDILGSLLEKLLQFVIEIVYECERDEGSGLCGNCVNCSPPLCSALFHIVINKIAYSLSIRLSSSSYVAFHLSLHQLVSEPTFLRLWKERWQKQLVHRKSDAKCLR